MNYVFALQNVATCVNSISGYRIMPGYKRKMKPLRKDCHPDFIVSEDGEMASCGLQELAHHTASRIFLEPELLDVVEKLKARMGYAKFHLSYKVGFDTASGWTNFQQGGGKKVMGGGNIGKDSHCMSSSLVILQLTYEDENGKEHPCAENPLMNSPWACRPLRIYFDKETKGNL